MLPRCSWAACVVATALTALAALTKNVALARRRALFVFGKSSISSGTKLVAAAALEAQNLHQPGSIHSPYSRKPRDHKD